MVSKTYDLMSRYTNEAYEDGMESLFSKRLCKLVKKHGLFAIMDIISCHIHGHVYGENMEEALRWLGIMKHKKTHDARLALLIHFLDDKNFAIRDAATIGIEAIGDPVAKPALKRAIEREDVDYIKKYMTEVMEGME